MASWNKRPTGPPPAELPALPIPPDSPPSESAWEDSSDDDEPARPQTAIHTPTQSFESVMKLNMKISQENLLRSITADPSPNELAVLKGLLSEMFHAYVSMKVPGGAIGAKIKTGDEMRALFDEKLKNETNYELYDRYRKANPVERMSFRASNGLPRGMFRELMRQWDRRVADGSERKEDGHLGSLRFLIVVGVFLERFLKDWKPKLVLPGKAKKKTPGNVTPKASSSK